MDHGGSRAGFALAGRDFRHLPRTALVQHGLPGRRGAGFLFETRVVPPENLRRRLRRLLNVRTRLPGPVHRFPQPPHRPLTLRDVPRLRDVMQTQWNLVAAPPRRSLATNPANREAPQLHQGLARHARHRARRRQSTPIRWRTPPI